MGRSQVQEVSYTLTLCQCKCALCVLQTCINLQSLLQSSPSSSPASDPTIVSSDFKRTSETAEIVRKHFQIESHVRYERTLRERNFGDFNLTSQTNYQKVWDVDSRNTHHTKYGCESVTSVVSRVSQLVRRLDEESEGKIILLVSHGDTLQILTTLFLGIAPGLHKTLPDIPQAGLRELTGDLNSYKPHRFTQ